MAASKQVPVRWAFGLLISLLHIVCIVWLALRFVFFGRPMMCIRVVVTFGMCDPFFSSTSLFRWIAPASHIRSSSSALIRLVARFIRSFARSNARVYNIHVTFYFSFINLFINFLYMFYARRAQLHLRCSHLFRSRVCEPCVRLCVSSSISIICIAYGEADTPIGLWLI